MKRVLIFSLAYCPYVGGAEIAIKEITDRIPREDIAFDIITLRMNKDLPLVEKVGNVRVYRVAGFDKRNPAYSELVQFPFYLNKVLFPLLAALGAYRLHRRFRYDAFWAMMSYMTFPIILLRLMGFRISYMLTLQEGDPFEHVFDRWYIRFVSPLLKQGFRKAAVIQTISTFLAGWARQMGFKGPLEVIPNAVNTAHFSRLYSNEELGVIQKRWGRKEGDVTLITTSRLVKKNAVDDVIRALAYLPAHIHFVVLGIGPDEDMLKKLAEESSVADRVHFLGQVDHADIPKYLKASDIFIRPSRSEGMGNSFVEAMAAGLPVIATQEGGIADFLFDEKRNPDKPTTGWAVDADAPEQIAEAVRDIMSRPEKVHAVTRTAHELVTQKYDWDLIARDMKEKVFVPLLQLS